MSSSSCNILIHKLDSTVFYAKERWSVYLTEHTETSGQLQSATLRHRLSETYRIAVTAFAARRLDVSHRLIF